MVLLAPDFAVPSTPWTHRRSLRPSIWARGYAPRWPRPRTSCGGVERPTLTNRCPSRPWKMNKRGETSRTLVLETASTPTLILVCIYELASHGGGNGKEEVQMHTSFYIYMSSLSHTVCMRYHHHSSFWTTKSGLRKFMSHMGFRLRGI